MANFNCVEPAQASGVDHYLVLAQATDQITFPAVDSCFAVAFVLSNGTLVGGHVPAFWDAKAFDLEISRSKHTGEDPQKSAMQGSLARIVEGMNGLRGNATVSLAITLGDADWSELWNGTVGRIGYPKEIRYRKPFGPRNLIVDGNTQNITVQAGGAGHYAAVPAAARTFADGVKKPQAITV
ncbi:MAG: hypothetical protein P4L26_04530 [Terracidiphilus sp.]|nr:hypothetical protein [Terracidiphilus sp.]